MVKIAATLFIATALASSALAQDFSGASSTEDMASREMSEQVFARAAAKVVQDLYSREDLSDLVGRELADGELISAREIEDLMEREIDWDVEFAARQAEEGEGAPEGEGASPPPSPSPKGPQGVTPKAAPPTPQQQGVFSRLMGVFGGLLNPKPAPAAAKKGSTPPPLTPKGKGNGPSSPPPSPPATPAPGSEGGELEAREPEMTTMLEEPLARMFMEEDLLEEREFGDEELYEREPEFDEELMEREPEFDEELMEREPELGTDEELMERELFDGEGELEQREVSEEELELREFVEELMVREPELEFGDMVEREFVGMDELD